MSDQIAANTNMDEQLQDEAAGSSNSNPTPPAANPDAAVSAETSGDDDWSDVHYLDFTDDDEFNGFDADGDDNNDDDAMMAADTDEATVAAAALFVIAGNNGNRRSSSSTTDRSAVNSSTSVADVDGDDDDVDDDEEGEDDDEDEDDDEARLGAGARALSLLSGPALPVVPSVLSSIMSDALSATNGQATAESVESLRQIVQRYEQTFKQFRQETESAIATFRQQFSDIRRKFETLKRIRQSLVMELVQPRNASGSLAAVNVVRHMVGGGGGGGGGGNGGGGGQAAGAAQPAGSSGVRRKRWGKRTSVRWRSDHNGASGGGGGSGRF